MEYFWYIVAALGAGIGTGLAGLSAATVMVPILLVMCPSFSGEVGAYQATAIALASDILGSAVTTAVYIRHKNIDLRRGWIMLACIVSMCVAGSFAAYQAGNVVLGGFSLFLTFCIGIRFLVKPESERKDAPPRGSAMTGKDVAISLFFGLTIGFGTGFVGTGGGMMMLVVFTFFLGMDHKTAVGTSTFIMTFTALIASISHIVIEPSILLERWDALIVCIVVATVSSLLSAQFANRVKNRTVGVVTGIVLVILGATMILLNYWNSIVAVPLLYGVICCMGRFLAFLVCGIAVLLPIWKFLKVPSYIFRKLLHILAFSALVEMTLSTEEWTVAAITALLFAALTYPVLCVLERYPWYDRLFVQKKPGEVKKSLVLLFGMIAAVIAFAWGVLGDRGIAVAATLMWGTGDAAAAIIGIAFGKHVVAWRFADGKKTWEGTLAMFVTAFIVGCAILTLHTALPFWAVVLIILPASAAAALTELISKGGNDTVTVPLTVTACLSLAFLVLGR